MADLIHVRPVDGSGDPTWVGQSALDRWPGIWEPITPKTPAPVGEETKTTPVVPIAPTGKNKE